MSLQDDALVANSCSFWEEDSFKTTVRRTEDGMQMCNEIMKLIQERAEIEKEYAKKLKAWAKKWNDNFEKGPEYGTNKLTWKKALDEADRMGDVHLFIKDRLMNNVQADIKEWKNDNYKKQMVGGCKEAKTFEDDFRKVQKPWSKRFTKVLKCKKEYHIACKLEKTATNQENNARNSSDVSADQLKKFHEKVEKCLKDVELTKVRYEQSLAELNSYNAKYVEDMTDVYNRTQDFEEKRLKFFKKILYDLHATLDLTQNSSIPEIYSQFRTHIGDLDTSEDLKWWSVHHGVDMPMAWPAFEEYSTEFHTISRKEKGKSTYISGIGDGVMLTAVQKNDSSVNNRSSVVMDAPSAVNGRENGCRPVSASIKSHNPFGEDDWDEYDSSTVQENARAGTVPAPSGVQVKALFSYEGQEADELSFEAGDVFTKLKDRDDQGWCTGCKDGQIGLFPDNYVQVTGGLEKGRGGL